MEITKDFVPYEQALALKELGFDEPCFGYYDEEDQEKQVYEYANCSGNVTGDRACYNDDFLSVTNTQLDKYGAFCSKDDEGIESYSRWTAPTFSQVFRWFREKYDLPNHIHTMWQHDWSNYSYQWHITEDKEEWNCIEHYKTYEEAELACLKKLIEIVKQNSK